MYVCFSIKSAFGTDFGPQEVPEEKKPTLSLQQQKVLLGCDGD